MVKWTNSAKNDLKIIQDYISNDSVFYAKKVITKLIDKAETLNRFPEMGRMVPEVMDSSIRELIIYSYRIIYETSSGNVNILAVIHGKRDFDETFNTQ